MENIKEKIPFNSIEADASDINNSCQQNISINNSSEYNHEIEPHNKDIQYIIDLLQRKFN